MLLDSKAEVLNSMAEDFCFVIMPFSGDFKNIYETAIKTAVEEANLKCVRADEIEGAFVIHKQMIDRIDRAKIIIADLTGQNANVFYELGVAHALGANVILLAQSFNDVPFDLRVCKIINYRNTIGGESELKKKIKEAIASLETQPQESSNPVLGFLERGAQRVRYSEHEQVTTALGQARAELAEAQLRLIEYERTRQENRQLLDKNTRLQGVLEFVKRLFPDVPGIEHKEDDYDEALRELLKDVERKGEVTLPVQPSPDQAEARPLSKITFKRVNK
ncbi:MAG: hypothetical protein QOF02_3685 [Blastocatellia bacterium]|nr:hypothetical protein [Blastocatellia bacterium]